MNDKLSTAVTKAVIPKENLAAFADWQAALQAAITEFSGFKGLEINSVPNPQRVSWVITQRFQDKSALDYWMTSECRAHLMHQLKKNSKDLSDTVVQTSDALPGVTEVFVTKINPQKSEEYRQWISRVHQMEAKFPGFLGLRVQPPTEQQGENWVTFLQFDTLSNLEHWLESDQRKQLLEESKDLIAKLERHRMISPYEGWFSQKENAPALWKQTMIILLVLYPIVVLEMRFLLPWLTGLKPVVGTFIGNAISVALVSWPMMPLAIWFLGWWLGSRDWKIGLYGALTVLGLYLVEILLLWNLI